MSISTEISAPAKLRAAAKRFKVSPRELQILLLLTQGKNLKEIAGDLEISRHTVDFHMRGLRKKVSTHLTTHALAVILLWK